MINEISPKIPYASEKATGLREHLLKTPAAVKILSEEISTDYMKEIFPEEFLKKVLAKLQSPAGPEQISFISKMKKKVAKKMPAAIKEY